MTSARQHGNALIFTVYGQPVSGNHSKYRTGALTREARERREAVALTALAAVKAQEWQMPDYVRVDLRIVNIRMDRDNVMKELHDAMEGVCYLHDSRILDGQVTRIRQQGAEPAIDVHIEAVNGNAYGFAKPRKKAAK